MWILTQNKQRILGTEGLEEIRVADPKPDGTDYAVMIKRRRDGQDFSLGFYPDKARAVEVLKDMFAVQGNYVMSDSSEQAVVYVPPKTYKMPPYNRAAK